VGSHIFPTMGTTKKVDPIRSKGWTQMQCDKPKVKGWGRPNLMRIIIEKMFEGNQENGSLRRQTIVYLHLAPHKI